MMKATGNNRNEIASATHNGNSADLGEAIGMSDTDTAQTAHWDCRRKETPHN